MVGYEVNLAKRKGMEMEEAEKSKKRKRHHKTPQWLPELIRARFWGQCREHSGLSRSEENIFCLDCRTVSCARCSHGNAGHRVLQVRRYVYRSVVRVDDIRKHLDLTKIQTYTINRSKAVHIRPMKQSQQNKGVSSGAHCMVCGRSITNAPNRYCSIVCKLNEDGTVDHSTLGNYDLYRADDMEPSFPPLSPQPSDSTLARQCHTISFSVRRRTRKQARPMRGPFS